MPKDPKQPANPLFSKNIPGPPAEEPLDETKPAQRPTTQTGSRAPLPQNRKTAKREKITFYLEPELAGKLYDFMEAYRRRTGVRINQQDMLRRIIDVATADTVLP